MPEGKNRNITFILGVFFVTLSAIALFMWQYSNPSDTSIYDNSSLLVETNDPFITRRLSEKDLLPDDVPLITFIDPARGPKDAPVTIVEFSDFQCPFCKEMNISLQQLLQRYPDSIRHIWKDAPSGSIHPQSFAAHLAARCSQEQNAFWEFHDALFQNQTELHAKKFYEIAQDININTKAWQSCFETEETKARVERSIAEAEVLGVDATPFLFINNKRISGNVSLEELDQLIRKELPL